MPGWSTKPKVTGSNPVWRVPWCSSEVRAFPGAEPIAPAPPESTFRAPPRRSGWDGPDLTEAQAPLIAAPYAVALAQVHPEASLTTIGVWQARRQTHVEVPIASALLKSALPRDFSSVSRV